MALHSISKKNITTAVETTEIDQASIDTLDRKLKELFDNRSLTTLDDVEQLSRNIEKLKNDVLQKQKDKPVYLRPFAKIKMWNVFSKIRELESLLQNLKSQALRNQDQLIIDRAIRDLQKKGLLLSISKETELEAFTATLSEMKALGCHEVFTFHIANREEGALELLVFTQDAKLSCYPVDAKQHFNAEAFLQKHTPSGIPLSQLQDVSGWLQNHGSQAATFLSREAIEKKLEALMHSCPHGAYVLHAQNKALTLSRLIPSGKIEHVIIDLQKRLGCYTIEREGKDIPATRTQFKRRLEQMGTPIRLVTKQTE